MTRSRRMNRRLMTWRDLNRVTRSKADLFRFKAKVVTSPLKTVDNVIDRRWHYNSNAESEPKSGLANNAQNNQTYFTYNSCFGLNFFELIYKWIDLSRRHKNIYVSYFVFSMNELLLSSYKNKYITLWPLISHAKCFWNILTFKSWIDRIPANIRPLSAHWLLVVLRVEAENGRHILNRRWLMTAQKR